MGRKRQPLRSGQTAPGLPIWQEALCGVELLLLHASPIYYGFGVPRGDRSGVIVVPGLLANDFYLAELHGWLKRVGYRPYYSKIGVNAECPNLLIRYGLNATIQRAVDETGGKVHLVGHSLGGMLARSAAATWPHLVASVITLAAPFRGNRTHPQIARITETIRQQILEVRREGVLPLCYTERCTCEFIDSLGWTLPKGVRETAIYTRSDGLVDWRCCLSSKRSCNFEVVGTHIGLVFNPAVYSIIGQRLMPPPRRT